MDDLDRMWPGELNALAVQLRNNHRYADAEAVTAAIARRWPLVPAQQLIRFTSLFHLGRWSEAAAVFDHREMREHLLRNDTLGRCLYCAGEREAGWLLMSPSVRARLAATLATLPDGAKPVLPSLEQPPHPASRVLVKLPSPVGIGSEIMYLSLAREAAERCAALTVECDPRLLPLAAPAMPGIALRARAPSGEATEVDGAFDCTLDAFELGAWLRSGTLRPASSFLAADTQRTAGLLADYRARFPGETLIGIVQRTSNSTSSWYRDIPLAAFASAAERLPGIRFVSLDPAPAEMADRARALRAEWLVVDQHIDPIADLPGQAAQIAALDGVVSIDCTAVPPAGALGVATTMLLSRPHYWQWPAEGSDSGWYRSVNVLRYAADASTDDLAAAIAAAAAGLRAGGRKT